MLSEVLSYTKNVGWLVLLPLAWNVAFSSRLPRRYSSDGPASTILATLSATENILRIFIFALPFFAPFELISYSQKLGITVFGVGLAIYFISWLPLIAAPDSKWSASAAGFLAPAYTPIVWLFGLALLMQRLHWESPYRWWFYLVLSIGFVLAHVSHAAIGFQRFSHGNSG
jgi:hypothetical protein